MPDDLAPMAPRTEPPSHAAAAMAEMRSTGTRSTAAGPVVWLLQGPRLGDNEQVLALGAALRDRFGWATTVRQVKYTRSPRPGVAPAQSLDHVDLAASDPIFGPAAGPAPDLVISVGRRAAPVARWLKLQAGQPGIHVQLGRYQDDFRDVDLLATTAQYALPGAANVLHLTLPITARPEAALDAAARAFAADFAAMPRPLIGVLVGGPSKPIDFGEADGRKLLERALAHAGASGGTLLVATSPRTPAIVHDLFARDLPAPHRYFPFRRDRQGPNPYLALLALCDAFIVTSDSVSMLADATLTGRPLHLFDLPVTPRPSLWIPSRPLHWLGRRRLQRLEQGRAADFLDRCFEAAVRSGRAQPIRHVPILTNRLLRDRLVTRLGEARPVDGPVDGPVGRDGQIAADHALADLCARELEMVTSRIAALLAERRARIEARNLERRVSASSVAGPPAGGHRLAPLAPAAE
jgi:mitochondrial fission protein ELM1